MKKIYTLIITSLIVINAFGQIGNGITAYTVSIPTTTVTMANLKNASAFVIDNTGNKWIGFAYYIGSSVNSFQLLRYNGTQWDTFPAFNAIYSLNKVNALAVDASNNLWIGSNRGLTKYDGTTFTTYNTANSTIKSDTIISLACNSGNVYAGSYKGLSVYNGTTFTNYNRATNGMKSDTIYCITEESASVVWLGNRFGMDKFNGSTFTFSYVASGNVADVVNCIYIDAANNKWLGTNAHGVIKYDNTNFYTMQQLYPNPSTLQDLIGCGGFPTIVKSICQGPNGGVLFGTVPQVYSGMPPSAYGSIEITNTQLYYYSNLNVAASTGTPVNYGILQYDVGSNKIFWVRCNGYPYANAILYSFDASQYVPDSLDVSTATTAFLDINNVNALICPNSQQHWDNTSGLAKYFVPKQNNTSPLRASAMWIGGYVNNSLRVAAMTYRQNGYDFWPGPLDPANDSISTATMLAYNKVWKVNRYDIANFTYNWTAGNVQSGTFSTPASILYWPGNSPYGAGQLAPYIDLNHNGTYDPLVGGDYPLIKGDQMIWSVYNDRYNKHGETGSVSNLGIEVHASAYAFTCPNIADSNVVINNTTFYNYQIINRSTNQYDSTRISLWMDADLGNYQDDYVGCDVMNDFGYTYNGENYDGDVGATPGYHSNLPVFACNVLGGPLADIGDGIDNNHNCVLDEVGERCMMSGFIYYNNSGSPLNGNPSGAMQGYPYYYLMSSVWQTGTPMVYGASGLPPGSGQACKYLYPGISDPYGYGLGYEPLPGSGGCGASPPILPTGGYGSTGWTEIQAGNAFGDRRFMVNIGPFTMKPDSSYQLDYALVFSQDSAHCYGNDTCPINRAVKDNQRVKRWFNTNSYPSCLSLVGVGIKGNTAQSIDFKLYPNPANSVVYIEFEKPQSKLSIEVYDMLGKVIRGLQYNEAVQYISIPLNDLQSGLYMVKIQTNEGTSIKKFVKE